MKLKVQKTERIVIEGYSTEDYELYTEDWCPYIELIVIIEDGKFISADLSIDNDQTSLSECSLIRLHDIFNKVVSAMQERITDETDSL